MRLLYPNLRLATLLRMLRYAAIGATISGIYGIMHDQITFTISAEYFTRLKFVQFRYANFGGPTRVFVGEVGFLATWWVGFLAAWFLARSATPKFPGDQAFRYVLRGVGIIFGAAVLGGLAGYGLGLVHGDDFSSWKTVTDSLAVKDVRSFVRVAYIHNGGYIGALLGLILAITYIRRAKARQ